MSAAFLTEVQARRLLADGYTPAQLARLWHVLEADVLARLAELGVKA